ncbi:MAG: hypothetical protein HY002_14195 [Candidatus Rokubacteria bacterium]|nr:hypothetical protein [Candidatus Rokubacteria bacterium]
MAATGLLETMARGDLDALVEEVGASYRAGALEALSVADPEWRDAVDRVEREVGGLYQALHEADLTWGRWCDAVAELRRLWARAGDVSPLSREGSLEDVA